jgi:hypothetical protein
MTTPRRVNVRGIFLKTVSYLPNNSPPAAMVLSATIGAPLAAVWMTVNHFIRGYTVN